MRVLAKLGDSLGADKLIPITSAHIVESSYQIACDAGMELIEKLSSLGAKCSVPTTSDPAAIDLENWRDLKIPEDYARKQLKLAELLNRLNVAPTFNCTPYADVNVPKFGDNVAWSESNAVVYVNSIYGARTNRYPAYVDLFAAIIGKIPNFGLHLNENRKGRVLVKLDVKDFEDSDFPVLGTYLGLEMGEKIPLLTGFPKNVSGTQLKGIGAAGAAAGALAMYHIEGLTPEARTRAEGFQGCEPEEKVTVDRTTLTSVRERMCTVSGGKVDIVGLGCPHASVFEIGEIVRLLNGRKIKNGVECWVCTSRISKGLADKMGYSDKLSAAGVRIICDTCCNDAPMKNWGFRLMATNSGKFARYASVNVGADVVFGSTKQCVDSAVEGGFSS
jgi:predicted aconitase